MHGQVYILGLVLFGLLLQVLGLAWAIARAAVPQLRSRARTVDRVIYVLCTVIFVAGALTLALFLVGQAKSGGAQSPLWIALFVSTVGWVAHRWGFKRIVALQP